jgi:hypothetical protein
MVDFLTDLDKQDRYPIWVISYNRAGSAPLLQKTLTWERKDDINIVVRESQAATYRAAYPGSRVHGVEDDKIDCVGKARWMAAELAYAMGDDVITMMDDDVLSLRFMFLRTFIRGRNAGKPCTGHSTLDDIEILPDLEERIISGMSSVAADVFSEHPRAVIGGSIKQHMSFDVKNQETKYILNGGVTPRQCMVWNVGRMHDFGIRLNLDRFGIHGDDIGIVAEALKEDADCFAMPSFAYEHWPESINIKTSVVRNAESAKALHEFEWESLQMYPIRDYLRVKRSIVDGSFEWGDVNWKTLGKIRGREPQRVYWRDPSELLEELL